jgi:formylglycine-generating enzyme required for sulfatase activity
VIYRLLKGGSFDDVSWYLRCTLRDWDSPEFRVRDNGFRLVVRRQA